MREIAWGALLSWPIVTVALCIWLGARRGSVASLLAGWALLPTATFGAEILDSSRTSWWIIGAALPAGFLLTKASVIGFSVLLGSVLVDGLPRTRPRLNALDVMVIAWCFWPLAVGAGSRLPLGTAAVQAVYLALAWGGPYLVGRRYLATVRGLTLWAIGWAAAGLVSLPFATVELLTGPHWYRWLYGGHPFLYDGAGRYVGFRPLLLAEHGNQAGLLLALAALAATWCWRHGPRIRVLGIPAGVAAFLMIGFTVAAQSAGAILLMGVGLTVIAVSGRKLKRTVIVLALALIVGYLLVRGSGVLPARKFAEKTWLGQQIRHGLEEIGRGSFGWRLNLEDETLDRAWERPLLGWGRWDWWRDEEGQTRPWGLWILVFGMYGVVGLALLTGMSLGPFFMLTWCGRHHLVSAAAWLAAGLIAIQFADALLNSTFITILIAGGGGVAGYSQQLSAASRDPDQEAGTRSQI